MAAILTMVTPQKKEEPASLGFGTSLIPPPTGRRSMSLSSMYWLLDWARKETVVGMVIRYFDACFFFFLLFIGSVVDD